MRRRVRDHGAEAPDGPVEQKAPSTLRVLMSNPLYRGVTVAEFLSALGVSAAAPQIASFLVKELDASLGAAGLYYLTSLAAPVVGYLVGARSDRTGRRMGLFRLCAAAGFFGWLGVAASTHLWMPFVIGVVLLGFAGAAGSQLFAAMHDEMTRKPSPANDGIVSIARMAMTSGWVIGPAAGTLVASHFGLREMLVATALCCGAQIIPLGTLKVAGPEPSKTLSDGEGALRGAGEPGIRAMSGLLIFTGLYLCVYAGEPVKYAYLPIYMDEQLHFAPGVRSAIIGIQPLVELALMPLVVMLARRTGAMWLMAGAAACGVAANLCFATMTSSAGLFAGQVLMGAVWAVFASLGIVVAQRLLPTAVATASAIFLSSPALSSALGGLAGGLGATAFGLPHVFFLPMAFGMIAVVGYLIMASSPKRQRPGTSTPVPNPLPAGASTGSE
ncbi:MFS transporter [Streptomyces microflavus]|uniref:MFS transporter n=1 Tax=Streptomyces microflavus TaxID=1919 RepID=UPI00368E8E42